MRFAIVFVAFMVFYLMTIRYGRPIMKWLDDESYSKRLTGVFVVGALCVVGYIGVPTFVFSLTGDGLIPLSPKRAIPAIDVLRSLPSTVLVFGVAAIGIRLAHDGGLKILTVLVSRCGR